MVQEDPGQDQEMVPVLTHQEVEVAVVAVALEVMEVVHQEEVTTVGASGVGVEAVVVEVVDITRYAAEAEAVLVLMAVERMISLLYIEYKRGEN